MKTLLSASALLGMMFLGGSVRADEPNPEVTKAIQEIAARRVAKEEARVKQVETWSKGEAREGRWQFGGGAGGAAPGAAIQIINK